MVVKVDLPEGRLDVPLRSAQRTPAAAPPVTAVTAMPPTPAGLDGPRRNV